MNLKQAMYLVGAGSFVLAGISLVALPTGNFNSIKCDPLTLVKGVSTDVALSLCGRPYLQNQSGDDWYPLLGDKGPKTESQWVYSSPFGDHTNLYFSDGKLTSVQVFGKGK